MISFFNALTFLWIAKTPPEKAVNKQFGFQTKKSKKSQENWDIAQKEMIAYAEKVILPSCIIGFCFLIVEVYLFFHWSENKFAVVLLIETLVPIISYLKLYFHVSEKLPD